MAGVLVIFKRQRLSQDVAWFNPMANSEISQLAAYGSQTPAGPLTQIRTIYFFTVADYTSWASSPAVQALAEARNAYHSQVGISEFKEVVSLTSI